MSFLSLLLGIAGAWWTGAPDSVTVLRSARRAQEVFEYTRRHNLPEREGGWSGVCGERIGRVCYWYEAGDDAEDRAPAEPSPIRQARARLLDALDRAAAAIPGDEWIVGQRVRYHLEDSQPSRAARVVAECRAVAWWCEALDGLVRHVTGDFVGADSVFAAALSDMPGDERCDWSDISALLDGDLAARYRRLDCASRAAFEARWWWLAQPLYSLGGNDRRTEHFARRVMVRIEQGRRTPLGLYWDDDLRDVMLRYGWPTWWTRDPPISAYTSSDPRVTGHEPSPAFQFAPAARALEDPGSARPDDWRFQPPSARERYAPAYAKAFTYLEHQRAVFRRGDSCLVVAAYDLSADTLFAARPVTTALALGADERTLTTARDSAAASGPRALIATAPCQPLVFSLEAVAPRERHVTRARYGLTPVPQPGQHPAISDLLLFDPPDSLPTTLAAAVPHARPSTRVSPNHRLGVFWELYGTDPASAVAVSLTVSPEGTGWLRRAVEAVGLATRRRGVRMEWQEVPEGASLVPRALALDLSGLSPGRYTIEVAVAPPSGDELTARKEIRIERR